MVDVVVGALVVFAGLAFVTLPFWWRSAEAFVYALQSQSAPEAAVCRMVLQLLEHDGWQSDMCRVWHSTGVSIWISNGQGNLGLRVDGEQSWPNSANGGIPLSPYWKRQIWRAIQKSEVTRNSDKLEAQQAKFAQAALEFAQAKISRP